MKLKRMAALACVIMLGAILILNGCGANTASSSKSASTKTVTITAKDATGTDKQIDVPYDPQRIAILDLSALDIIDNLGYGDRVVGSADTTLDYLKKYTGGNIVNLGNIKEADMEAVAKCNPDIIFIGGRLSSSYDALNEIAPVVYLSTDATKGVVESTHNNARTIGSIFGAEEKVDALFTGFNDRIAKLNAFAKGKTAVLGMATSGSLNILGNDGRCSLIVNEVGFDNIGASSATSRQGSSSSTASGAASNPHGAESSFETLVSLNPEYVFVLDRDSAIGTDGAKLAQDIMNNDLINGMDASKNNKIVYLAHPAAWYTAEGGVTALDTMISDLESSLLK